MACLLPSNDAMDDPPADCSDKGRRRAYPREACPHTPGAEREHGMPSVHSITRSARKWSDCGIVIPSAFAVLRLITNSNLVGCSIGISAGFVPFSILLTWSAARR